MSQCAHCGAKRLLDRGPCPACGEGEELRQKGFTFTLLRIFKGGSVGMIFLQFGLFFGFLVLMALAIRTLGPPESIASYINAMIGAVALTIVFRIIRNEFARTRTPKDRDQP